jgi:hypothetical protein
VIRAALALATVLAAGAARAEDDYDRLGRLEREEVDAVLAERGLAVDRAPAGKSIRRVLVVTRPVFGPGDGFLRVFNVFHVTTRPRAVERELLFRPGTPWDAATVDETLRNLRDPLRHNVIVVLPVASGEAGSVDALVVVRDVWSLRLNSNFQTVGSTLTDLVLSLTETNLLGLRKRAAVVFNMDQGAFELGPLYDDPNLAGTRVTVRSLWRLSFGRDDGELEGSRSETVIAYPFRSYAQRWAASLEVAHSVGITRSFLGTALRTYDAPETEAVEAAPWRYLRKQLATEAQVVAGFGARVVQRVGVGHELSLSRPRLPADFPDDPALAAAFTRDVLPRSELASAVFARWQLFTPVYATVRDLSTFDFREDYLTGPEVEARVSQALQLLGSERDFTRFTLTARWTSGWAGGLWRAAAGAAARLEGGRLIDRQYALAGFAASPVLARALRLVAAVDVDWLEEDAANRLLVLGGANGLRGYAINAFAGQARAVAHLELRSRPLHLFRFYRLGAVAFWDAGDAAEAPGDLALKHGVGVGLRSLIPQLDTLVIRLDWAFALNGADAGWPGRLSLGVLQVF